MTAAEALRRLRDALAGIAGGEAPGEARLMLAHILGCAPAELGLKARCGLTPAQEDALAAMLSRRLNREPLQYILGEWSFMGLPFLVRPGALIPRPETEILCERALLEAKARGYRTALDLCCGTGCIGVSLAKLGGLAVTAADLSPGCAALTAENAQKNGVELTVLTGSYFAPVTGRFDLILSNPPYISGPEMETLQPELAFEPRLALYGGEDGLDAYRSIAGGYLSHLAPGGMLILEVGYAQADAVRSLFDAKTQTVLDYSGVRRALIVYAPAA